MPSSLLALTPMILVPFVKLTAMVLKKFDIYNDQQMFIESGIDLSMLPIFMFFACLPLTLMLSGGVWLTVLAAGNALNSAAARVFGATAGIGEVVAELAMTGISKVPAVVAVALVAIAFSTCGALALFLAAAFYLMQLFDMYKDHVRKVIAKLIPRLQDETVPEPPAPTGFGAAATASSTNTNNNTDDSAADADASPATAADDTSSSSDTVAAAVPKPPVVPQSSESLSLQLHMSLLLLVVVSAALQTPSLITWAVRMKQGVPGLAVDPSLVPSVATLAALAVLWQCSPTHDRRHYKLLGHLVHFITVLALLFSNISLYKLPYFVAAALVIVAIHQLLAPKSK